MKHYNKSSEKQKRRILRRNQTFSEKVVWLYLKNRRTLGCKFRRQYSVDKFVIDFYCPVLKLAIEIDGSVHNNPESRDYDYVRQKYLEKFGISFLRITDVELFENENLAFTKIKNEIIKLKRRRRK